MAKSKAPMRLVKTPDPAKKTAKKATAKTDKPFPRGKDRPANWIPESSLLPGHPSEKEMEEMIKDAGVQPFHEWMSYQRHHSESRQREAARYILGRWTMDSFYRHPRILRILRSERSEHLAGAEMIADEYIEFFGDLLKGNAAAAIEVRNSTTARHSIRLVDCQR